MTNRKRLKIRLAVGAAIVASTLIAGGMTAAVASNDNQSQSTTALTNTQDCQMLNSAITNAVDNQLSIMDMFMKSADKNMKRIMNNSCLSALQLLNINLGALIPDFSIFGAMLDALIDRVITYLTDQVCEEINSRIGDWNEMITELGVDWNVNSSLEKWANDVVMTVPGGSAPALTIPGSNNGVIGTNNQINVFDTTTPVTCSRVGNAEMCTDGSVRSIDGNTSSSSSSSTSTSVGAGIGSVYAQKLKACEDAYQDWASVRNSNNSWNQIESTRLNSLAICNDARTYYNTNTTYLSGLSAPNIPSGLTQVTPNNQSTSTFSLPVRQ